MKEDMEKLSRDCGSPDQDAEPLGFTWPGRVRGQLFSNYCYLNLAELSLSLQNKCSSPTNKQAHSYQQQEGSPAHLPLTHVGK